MGRAAYIVGAVLLALAGAGPATAATATATARVTIIEGNVVRINWTMGMPSVQVGGGGAAFVGAVPSTVLGMRMMPTGGRLMVRRRDPSGSPMTAPTSFEVVRAGGEDAVIVTTANDTETTIARDRVIVGGALQGAAAASIEVARGVAPEPASAQTLVVVVQYN
ncbi:MAG: hypothetical protein KKE02_02140 [Alphaproteobacteria bacterium]|nr:hypothetical protein [Alphaproteobacteria bacterium]MBU1513873.1 hypothetical protein [Alphaproteobacteria bacterium]MBU2094482.1 hypothetical protein [Alphaproteobacteria bacterium]MBU2149792.1 hypothetical protein [Alphaproteobacteria bacterium]MBU2307263.1 hypothetical protein [Alphaproteobacteria bacterium]